LPVLPMDFADREWFKLEGAAPSTGDWAIEEAAFQPTVRRIYEFAAGLAR
jgi:hypothetical protein